MITQIKVKVNSEKYQPTVVFLRRYTKEVLDLVVFVCYNMYITKKGGEKMYDSSLLGENIRKYRRIAGLTQSELAEKLFLTAQNISKWETGKSYPDLVNLCSLARELGGVV